MNICEICTDTIEEDPLNLPCSHQCCSSCLFSWSTTQIENAATTPSTIKCFEKDCSIPIPIATLLLHFRNPELQELSTLLTKVTLRTTHGYIACPQPNCSNIGFNNNEEEEVSMCKDPYSCDACGHQWHEMHQISVLSRFKRNFWENLRELFSTLHIEVVCKWCPQCQAKIFKTYGCNHMVCSRCNHEFCWYCSHPFPKYQHIPSQSICDNKAQAVFIIVVFVFVHILWNGGILDLLEYLLARVSDSWFFKSYIAPKLEPVVIGLKTLPLCLLSCYSERIIVLSFHVLETFVALEPCWTIAWVWTEIEKEKKSKYHKKNRKRRKAQRSHLRLLTNIGLKQLLYVVIRSLIALQINEVRRAWFVWFGQLIIYPILAFWANKKGRIDLTFYVGRYTNYDEFFNRWDYALCVILCISGLLNWHVGDFEFHLSA